MQALSHLINQYKLLSGWYLSALDGIKDEDGSKTINEHTNSLEWIAGHLNTGRYRNLLRLGVEVEPYKHLDKFVNQTMPPPNAVPFDTNTQYASLTECRDQWTIYTKALREALENIDETALKAILPSPMPTGGNTVEDALVFVVLHETYHIGQMSILRKSLGYPSMQLLLKK